MENIQVFWAAFISNVVAKVKIGQLSTLMWVEHQLLVSRFDYKTSCTIQVH